jgi:hypothetical protein
VALVSAPYRHLDREAETEALRVEVETLRADDRDRAALRAEVEALRTEVKTLRAERERDLRRRSKRIAISPVGPVFMVFATLICPVMIRVAWDEGVFASVFAWVFGTLFLFAVGLMILAAGDP